MINVFAKKSPLGILTIMLIHVQDGMTPLYIASDKGHGAVGKLLLQQQADVSICTKVMCLPRSSMYFYDFMILL